MQFSSKNDVHKYNRPSQKEFHLQTIDFQGLLMLVLGRVEHRFLHRKVHAKVVMTERFPPSDAKSHLCTCSWRRRANPQDPWVKLMLDCLHFRCCIFTIQLAKSFLAWKNLVQLWEDHLQSNISTSWKSNMDTQKKCKKWFVKKGISFQEYGVILGVSTCERIQGFVYHLHGKTTKILVSVGPKSFSKAHSQAL